MAFQKKQEGLVDGIEVILNYDEAGINLSNGDHHGIGYLDGKLVLFKSHGLNSVVSRIITIAEELEWLGAMHVAQDASEPGRFSSSSADPARQLRWYQDLRAALTSPK